MGVLLLFFAIFIYFSFNPSYEKSFEARFYFTIGNYQEAFDLANEALQLEAYNNMAFSIRNQSKLALEFVEYNSESDKYLDKISKIIETNEIIPNRERIRIKMISEIMIDKYNRLSFAVVQDGELKDKAEINYSQFKQLFDEIKNSIKLH
jgi:tetratricopeptide (TPR) repeat protein